MRSLGAALVSPVIGMLLSTSDVWPTWGPSRALSATACLLGVCELIQNRFGLCQRNAGVRYALAVHRGLTGYVVLPSFDQVTLEHGAKNLPRPGGDLLGNGCRNLGLATMILAAVAVGAIDHDWWRQRLRRQLRGQRVDMFGVVVGARARAATENHMTGVVTGGLKDRRN